MKRKILISTLMLLLLTGCGHKSIQEESYKKAKILYITSSRFCRVRAVVVIDNKVDSVEITDIPTDTDELIGSYVLFIKRNDSYKGIEITRNLE